MPATMARKAGAMAAVAAMAGGTLALAAGSASAAPRTPVPYYNCTYPYVCLYNDTVDIVARYRDVTSGFQSVPSNVYYGLNTRNDDIAFIRYTDGSQACLPSGDPMALYYLREFGTPNGIRIDSRPDCPAGMARLTAKKAS